MPHTYNPSLGGGGAEGGRLQFDTISQKKKKGRNTVNEIQRLEVSLGNRLHDGSVTG